MPHKKRSDTELLYVAFEDWKRDNGMGKLIELGDIDSKTLGQVLQRAQAMKIRAQEKKSA